MKKKTVPETTIEGRRSSPAATQALDAALVSSLSNDNHLRAIIDGLEDEILVMDRNYQIIDANKALLARYGKRKEEVIGRHCFEISAPFSAPCLESLNEDPIRTVWETGKSAHITHIVADDNGDRQKKYVEVVASPVIDGNGKISSLCVLMRDATETKQLESRIAQAEEELSALNAIASVVTKSLDLDIVLRSALETTLEIMQQSTGGIMLLDEAGETLTYRVYHGLSAEYAREMRLKLGEGISGRVAQTGKAILIEDLAKYDLSPYRDLISIEGLHPFASVPLRSKEKILGVLNITSHETDRLSQTSFQLLESIAAQIAIAIDNARLYQEVQQKEVIRGELLQDIFTIQEEERKQIARELHDETSQVLASLTGNLEAAAGTLPEHEDKTKSLIRKAQTLAIKALDETHRLIYELRPTLLDDLGLIAATRWLITNHLQEAGIKVTFETDGTVRRLAPQLETTIFRVVQEAVINIARHAYSSKASIRLHFKKNLVKVRVKDNGKGFDIDEAIQSKDRPRGLGLLGMKERVELMKGTLYILSNPDGKGTEINIEIPVEVGSDDE